MAIRLLLVTHGYPTRHGEDFYRSEMNELKRIGVDCLFLSVSTSSQVFWDSNGNKLEVQVKQRLPSLDGIFRTLGDVGLRVSRSRLGAAQTRLRTATQCWRSLPVLAGVSHVHAFWSSMAAGVAEEVALSLGVGWSFAGHRSDLVADVSLARKLDASQFARSTNSVSDDLMTNHGGKVTPIRLGVDIPPAIPLRHATGKIVVVVPASLKPVKGHRILFQALAELNPDQFDSVQLYGEGPEEQPLRNQVADLNLDIPVIFKGYLPNRDLLALYRTSRERIVVCLPSVDLGNGLHEGLPMALIEAMAAGIPVVSTKTGGIRELEDSGAALLVPPQEASALANALATLTSSEQYASFSHKGRAYAVSRHSVETAAEAFMASIRRSLNDQ